METEIYDKPKLVSFSVSKYLLTIFCHLLASLESKSSEESTKWQKMVNKLTLIKWKLHKYFFVYQQVIIKP